MIYKLPVKPYAAALIFLIALGIPACGENGGNGGVDTLIEQGAGFLAEGDYDSAIETYETILAEHDSENPQAMWGIVIATLMNELTAAADSFDEIQDTLTMPPGFFSPPAGIQPQQTNGSGYDPKEFCCLFDDMLDRILPLLEALQKQTDFSTIMGTCALGIQLDSENSYTVDLGGEYDLGEVYVLSSLLKILKGLTLVCQATDTSGVTVFLDSGSLEYYPQVTDSGPILVDESQETVFQHLAGFLADTPDFLTLDTENGGAGLLAQAADLVAEAAADLLGFIDTIRTEEDDQSDDIITLEREGTAEYIVVRLTENGKPTRARARLTAEALSALEQIKAGFEADGGVRVSWGRDLVPLLAVAIGGFTTTCLFGQLQEIIGIDIFPVVPVDLSSLLLFYIPDIVELDFGKFLRDPSGEFFRALLPVTVTGGGGEPELLLEYECRDTLGPDDFWCSSDAIITSTEHFVGTDYHIPDDGLASGLPYIAVSDPSLGGLVYLNLHTLNRDEFADEFTLAGLYELNYLLAAYYDGFFGLIGIATDYDGAE